MRDRRSISSLRFCAGNALNRNMYVRTSLVNAVVEFINQSDKTIMQLFDVCTKRNYEVDGEKKVKWYRAGFMKTTERGNTYIRLFNQPDVDLYVFPKETEVPDIQAKE